MRWNRSECRLGPTGISIVGSLLLLLLPAVSDCSADDPIPELRREPGGPISFVSSLAWHGDTLYAGGWDKVVRAWWLDPATMRLVPDPPATYRIPVGPGLDGAINAVALSPDGKWLAIGGQGTARGTSDLQNPGLVVPRGSMTSEMLQDQGTIWLFDTRTQAARPLRLHVGPITVL